jgi:transcriptional repressor NrdR
MKIKQRRNKMKCPHCGFEESKVIDSRPIDDNSSIRRRRECLKCQARFTTYEVIENIQPIVIKKDGSREYFDKNKLLVGLLKACQKRPVDSAKIADEIEQELQNSLKLEITSYQLGEMVMEKLKAIDAVAYVRFASVYREFKDVETFLAELQAILKK